MGVFIDDMVRVEFHLEEAAVSLVDMGKQKLTFSGMSLAVSHMQ